MNLADLKQIPMNRKKRKRIGRGPASGQGKTAGRGENGQKSRSGYSRRMGFEGGQMPLYRRLPKKGFTNYLFRVEYAIVNTGQLNDFEAGTTVDVDMLKGAAEEMGPTAVFPGVRPMTSRNHPRNHPRE